MYRMAIYGKGGIGKSTTVSNLAAAFARRGLTVLQIGCDPKADSTINHHHGHKIRSVLEVLRDKPHQTATLEELVQQGEQGVWCVEAGGPSPGTGCAGRGIVAAFEALNAVHAFEKIRPDVVIYDVLGDVVCGGFAMPIRKGYAEDVFILTSGENMAIYAAGNIAQAVENYKSRGYARLSGIILNRRNVPDEDRKVADLAQTVGAPVIAALSRSTTVQQAEELGQTVVTAFPDSAMAREYEQLAACVLAHAHESHTAPVIAIQAGEL